MGEFGNYIPLEARQGRGTSAASEPLDEEAVRHSSGRGIYDNLLQLPTVADKGEKAGPVLSISDLMDRKAYRAVLIAGEANNLPSIYHLLAKKASRSAFERGREDATVMFNTAEVEEGVPEIVKATTVRGEVSFNPATGEVVIDGESKRVGERRRSVFSKMISSSGEYFTMRDLQQEYDPRGYKANVDPVNMKFVVQALRKDIDDPQGELIRSDRDLGYSLAVAETESYKDEWVIQKIGEKEYKYNPKNRRLVIDNGDPIKLSPGPANLWMDFLSEPGKLFTNLELTLDRTQASLKADLVRLRKIVGEEVIRTERGVGFGLNVS